MGIIVILTCFVGSGALTIFLVELFRDDRRKRKCPVTRVEGFLEAVEALNLERYITPDEYHPRMGTHVGTGTSSAAD